MNNVNIMDKIYVANDKMIIFLVYGKIINVDFPYIDLYS